MATAKLIQLHRNEDLSSEIERLNRLVSELQNQIMQQNDHLTAKEKSVLVNTDSISRYIKSHHVVMIHADSNYSTIHLKDGSAILTSKTLKHWEEKFQCSAFLRIHSSYLINSEYISYVDHKQNLVLMMHGCSASYSRTGKSLLKMI